VAAKLADEDGLSRISAALATVGISLSDTDFACRVLDSARRTGGNAPAVWALLGQLGELDRANAARLAFAKGGRGASLAALPALELADGNPRQALSFALIGGQSGAIAAAVRFSFALRFGGGEIASIGQRGGARPRNFPRN
jgi:hypothetical protein